VDWAEGRLFGFVGARKGCAVDLAIGVPQRLKPSLFEACCGTTEVVP
jgi:hypothetical protein